MTKVRPRDRFPKRLRKPRRRKPLKPIKRDTPEEVSYADGEMKV